MKRFLRIAHTNNFLVILCMAIMLSPLFFVMNSYAEGSNVASSSITRQVNIASGSDASFDDEEVDEEDDITDYPEEPEDDIDENTGSGDGNTGDNSDGEPQNDSSTETSNIGNTSSSSDPSADLSSDSSTVDPDTASTSSSSDSSDGSATEHTNDSGSNTSNASNQNLATSSDADEATNESEPEEQISNTNNNATRSTPSNIVPKLGLAPSTPFVPLGAGPNYLKFTAEANSTITLNCASGNAEYSTDGGMNWVSYTSGYGIILLAGNSVLFRGTNVITKSDKHFVMSGKIAGSGSVTSLIDNDGSNPSVTLPDNCFNSMFINCTALTTAPELPATNLTATGCYKSMFYGCNSLTTAPALPATNLSNACYQCMFKNCTSLTTLPELPATNLSDYCYAQMFEGCTGLTSIPTGFLPATNLKYECYAWMFKGCTNLSTISSGFMSAQTVESESCYCMFTECTSLTSVPVLPAMTLSGDYNYYQMFTNCTSLASLPAGMLPATDLSSSTNCYDRMFEGCTSLESLPNNFMAATTLSEKCCSDMFNGCTKLETVPFDLLKATEMKESCYMAMFTGCTKLEVPPEIKATRLADNCFVGMFSGCTSLVLNKDSATGRKKVWKIPATSDTGISDWNTDMFDSCGSSVVLHGTGTDCKNNTVYYTLGNTTPTPTPAPSGGGGGSSGGGGGGGTIDPRGKPLDPQIIGPGITSDPSADPFADPFAGLLDININVDPIVVFNPDGYEPIPPTDVPDETILPINYEESTTTKVEVIKKPIIVRSSSGGGGGGRDNAKLSLTDMIGNSYNATYGFYDVEVKNVNVDQKGTIDTYYVNESSNLVTGWIETANKKRYFMEPTKNQDEGKMCHGWKRIVSDWYFFDYDGSMMKGKKTPDGFVVDGEGKMTNPAFLDRALINGKQNRTVYTMEKTYKHD